MPSKSPSIVHSNLRIPGGKVSNTAPPPSQKIPGNKYRYTNTSAIRPPEMMAKASSNTPLDSTVAGVDNYIISHV